MSLNRSSTETRPPSRRYGPAVLLLGVLVGVAGGVGAISLWQTYHPPHTPSAAARGNLSVVDDAGRTVAVPTPPSRIVVLQPSAMDILFRLGLRSNVAGIDCGIPSIGGVAADYTPGQVANWSLRGIPCVTWIPSLDLSAIVALDPGLVIGAAGDAVSDLDTLQTTDHIPSLYLDASSLLGVSRDVGLVATLTGTLPTADAIVASMDQTVSNVARTVENTSRVASIPTVLLTYYDDPTGYYTFGPGTFGTDLLVDAGGASISANDTYANQGEISGSYVLASDPQVIIVGTGFGLTAQNYSQGPEWSMLSAVAAGHVYPVDATLASEPDPTMVLVGLPTLFAILHPGIPLGGG